ncbi:MAG: methylated-DNA--[protein]-cysteine S-methyltransferase [Nitrospirae bacterium]|nr:methylated-DNA--[protein]-cysteine S-methyltransferase [Nitrospirota bacterium]
MILVRLFYTSFNSSIGKIHLAATEKGLCAVGIRDKKAEFIKLLQKTYNIKPVKDDAVFKDLLRLLKRYLNGERIKIDIPFDLQGTLFEKKVWKALLKIPYGKTKSYGEIAKEIGLPNGARAVGNACGKNTIPVIIPCHRVIAGNGGLGGYTGGIEIKKRLLRFEGVLCSQDFS